MGRIIAIDYGRKRVGLAVTDPLKIIASPLDIITPKELIGYLERYVNKEEVEAIVVGMPLKLDNSPTDVTNEVIQLTEKLKTKFANLPVYNEDERFTSKLALDAAIASGMKKKDRRNKGNIDKISATIILQSFINRTGS